MEERSAGAGNDQGGGGASQRSSLGHYLASQRRLRGISLEDLAARTRIPGRNLERLESGAMDGESDGLSRGLVRTVAHELGLDADDAVMRLVAEPTEDSASRERAERRMRQLRVGLLASLALLSVLGWKLLVGWLAPGQGEDVPALVYRRDPVRALAAEQAAGGARELPVPAPRDETH